MFVCTMVQSNSIHTEEQKIPYVCKDWIRLSMVVFFNCQRLVFITQRNMIISKICLGIFTLVDRVASQS